VKGEVLMNFRVLLLLLITATPIFGEDAPVRVAVFQGTGVGPSADKLIATLQAAATGPFEITRLTAEAIRSGKLADVDVLVHPGGSGSKQGNDLGKEGRLAVRQFVKEGGGYLGVCGGAYLATNDYPWSLNLIDAKVVDKSHWARGSGTVTLQLSPEGSKFLRHHKREMAIHYAQGPLLARREWGSRDVPDYESLAIYATEIAKNGAPRGIMARTSAVVRCEFGYGRVFCFSPHPELTDGLHHLIPLSVQWLARRTSPAEDQ
jgi:glutamine amidotransferase-like uncharacterized protein